MRMHIVLIKIALLFPLFAQANLLDKVQLEELLQKRLESNLVRHDQDLRVQVKFIYRKPANLPGIALSENEEITPSTVTEGDIRSISVEIRTRLPEINKAMEEEIYNLLPIRKSRIKLKYTSLLDKPKTPVTPPVIAKDLWDISKVFSQNLSQLLIAIFAASLLLTLSFALFLHRSWTRNFKDSFGLIAKTMSETSGEEKLQSTANTQDFAENSANREANKEEISLETSGLVEIFADCYWCESDNYAHWLWTRISSVQKRELLTSWPLMRKYSDYFVSKEPQAQTEHLHPYYISPEVLCSYSQDVLQSELKKSPDLWLRLSPLRQKNLHVPISDKLRIVKKGETPPLPKLRNFSQERSLPLVAALGDLSFQDEKTLIAQPELVPQELRPQFSSLVWLTLQPKDYVESILSQYDAPSLATAWVGDESILSILEECLPEKKRKMVQSYVRKMKPSKKSRVYQELVKAGWHRESA